MAVKFDWETGDAKHAENKRPQRPFNLRILSESSWAWVHDDAHGIWLDLFGPIEEIEELDMQAVYDLIEVRYGSDRG